MSTGIEPVFLEAGSPDEQARTPGIQPGERFQANVRSDGGNVFTTTVVAPDEPGEYQLGNLLINPDMPSAGRVGDPGRLGRLSGFDADKTVTVEPMERAGGPTNQLQSTTDNNPETIGGPGGPGGLLEDVDGGVVAAALALIGLAAAIVGGT